MIQYEADSGVAHIRLSAPKTGNALNAALLDELLQSLGRATSDQSCRVIIISAEGPDFSVGMDFEAALATGPDPEVCRMFLDCLTLICKSNLPVIASVEGNVSGGGVGLVAACDLVLAAEKVVFMLPEVIAGMIPALVSPFLLRRLTPGRVRYMTLSTRGIHAPEAKVFGLVDEVAEDGIEKALNRQLQRLFRSSPRALAESKRYFDRIGSSDLHRETDMALEQLLSWLQQQEVIEGIRSFAQGYTPRWFQKFKG